MPSLTVRMKQLKENAPPKKIDGEVHILCDQNCRELLELCKLFYLPILEDFSGEAELSKHLC